MLQGDGPVRLIDTIAPTRLIGQSLARYIHCVTAPAFNVTSLVTESIPLRTVTANATVLQLWRL